MSIQSDCRTLAEEILKDDLRQLKDCISTLRAERDAARCHREIKRMRKGAEHA